MTRHTLYPAFITIEYLSRGNQHKMTLPTKISGAPEPGGPCDLVTYTAGPIPFATCVGNLVQALLPIYADDAVFGKADLWSIGKPFDDPIWMDTTTIVNGTGTNVGENKAFTQAVMSFRTVLGGIFKLTMVESTIEAATRAAGPSFGDPTGLGALAAFLVSNESFVYGRDSGRLITSMWLTGKINDYLRRKSFGA